MGQDEKAVIKKENENEMKKIKRGRKERIHNGV